MSVKKSFEKHSAGNCINRVEYKVVEVDADSRSEAESSEYCGTLIANKKIADEIEEDCFRQMRNASRLVGPDNVVLNPDCHTGYGVPIGSVIRSKDIIIPGSVGYDIKCSMSLLQLNVPAHELQNKKLRYQIMEKISKRIPIGMGKSRSKKQHRDYKDYVDYAMIFGFDETAAELLGIPKEWIGKCEVASHGCDHDFYTKIDAEDTLGGRLSWLQDYNREYTSNKMQQLGTYGAGNHFGECVAVNVQEGYEGIAEKFGLKHGHAAFLSHCGSRGFGHAIATYHFKLLQEKFKKWRIPLEDKELVYIPVGEEEYYNYIYDIALAGNFATINHMIINKLLLEAFQEIDSGITGELVYYISHNFVNEEYEGKEKWLVHRKGATRAFPAKHHALKATPFYDTGHPILLPGDPIRGSSVMVARDGAKKSFYSVNHGAGRAMSRTAAKKTICQKTVDNIFDERNVLTNCRKYPIDESHLAYKDFNEVIDSVTGAGLADEVARLKAMFVIKSGD